MKMSRTHHHFAPSYEGAEPTNHHYKWVARKTQRRNRQIDQNNTRRLWADALRKMPTSYWEENGWVNVGVHNQHFVGHIH